MNKKSLAKYTPSGCLNSEALMLFVSGSLKGSDYEIAQKHISECPLCADAADGLVLWLKENKDDHLTNDAPTNVSNSETSDYSNRKSSSSGHNQKLNTPNSSSFNRRTKAINDRIRERLHAHAKIEASETKRLSYNPFVWLSAAATIVLFIGSFYVLWLQNDINNQKLVSAKANKEDVQLTDSTITGIISDSSLALANKKNSKPQRSQLTLDKQEDVFNMDNLYIDPQQSQIADKQVVDEPEESSAAPSVARNTEIRLDEMSEKKDSEPAFNQQKPFQVEGVVVSATGASREKSATGSAAKNQGKEEDKVTKKTKSVKRQTESEKDTVFILVEEMPAFPGGEEQRLKFLAQNLNYPVQAAENGIQGTVYLSFIVRKNGIVDDIKILRGIGSGCDEEVLRVMKMMPHWIPGKQKGKAVDVLYNMPVIFTLGK